MGLLPPPRFHTLAGSSNFTASVWNFGTPQGTILSSTNSFSSPTLSRQVRQVEEAIQLLQLQYGPRTAPQVASSALYLLSFGTDDYMRILRRQSEVSSSPKYRRHKLGPLLVTHMVRAIKVSSWYSLLPDKISSEISVRNGWPCLLFSNVLITYGHIWGPVLTSTTNYGCFGE